MAQLALGLDLPGDAQRAIRAGMAGGTLSGDVKANNLLTLADKRAAADQVALSKAEELAAKTKNGDADVSIGEDYFGYAAYADAIRMAQAALAKGGSKMVEARLLLGAAQAASGDNAAGQNGLATVSGDPSMEKAAHLWWLYASRKYGLPAAQPVAEH